MAGMVHESEWKRAGERDAPQLPDTTRKLYAVVELLDESGQPTTSPALSCWLEGVTVQLIDGQEKYTAKKCWWPPSERYLSQMLLNKKKPKEDWCHFTNVRVFTFCKTLASARSLAEKAAFTSDITDNEDDAPSGKRSRRQTQFYGDSSSDDEHPPLKKLKLNTDSCTGLKKRDGRLPVQIASPLNCSSGSARVRSRSTSRESSPSQGSPTPSGKTPSAKTPSAKTPSAKTPSAKTPSGKTPSAGAASAATSVVNRSLLASFGELRKELTDIKKLIFKIYIVSCGPQEGASEVPDVPLLPLQNSQDMANFEEVCSTEDGKLGMVKYFSELGCNTLKDSTKSILKRLMTNKLAMSYNLSGINREGVPYKKNKFEGSSAYIVLKAAVKRHSDILKARGSGSNHIFNLENMNGAISNWLKDAPKRFKNEVAKQEKVNAKEANNSDTENNM